MNSVGDWHGEYGDARRFRYTRDYLAPGICSLIKPAAMKKTDAISRQKPRNHVIIHDMTMCRDPFPGQKIKCEGHTGY